MNALLTAAVTPVPVSVDWGDIAQGVTNQVITAFNDVTPVVLTLLGLGIAFRTTVRMIRRFAKI